MKKFFGFIVGLATMVVVFAVIYISAVIYDTSDKAYIEPFFMRLGVNSADMPNSPRPLADVESTQLRNWLIQKFVYEYLYIEPDVDNVKRRTTAGGFYSPLSIMSSPDVFRTWVNTVAQDMSAKADKGVRRTVRVFDEILNPVDSDYYRVDYETKTWYKPNDMTTGPVVERGTMYLSREVYTGALRQPVEDVMKLLRRGLDPAMAFGFRVNRVIMNGN